MNFGAVPPGEAKWVVGHVTTYEKDQGGVWVGGSRRTRNGTRTTGSTSANEANPKAGGP